MNQRPFFYTSNFSDPLEVIYKHLDIKDPDILCLCVGSKKLGIPLGIPNTKNNRDDYPDNSKYHLYAAALDVIDRMPKNERAEAKKTFLQKGVGVSHAECDECVNKDSLKDVIKERMDPNMGRAKK